MQKRRIFGGILLVLFSVVAWMGIAGAQSFQSGDNVTLSKGQKIDSTLWSSGKNLDIAGTVNGDIFCIGQTVTISGDVNGDVICAAQTIRISGDVSGDIRLAAQTATVSSKVAGSASVASQTFSLEQTGTIGRDASIAAREVNINGNVGRDAAVAAAQVNVAGPIGRDVKATVEHMRLESGAKVGGDLTYTSGKDASIDSGSQVAGVTHRYPPTKSEHKGVLSKIGIILNLYLVVSLLLLALAFVLLLPRMFHVVTESAVAKPLKTLLVGLVASLLFPVLFVALLVLVVGIPLALFLLLIWLVIIGAGWLFFSYYIGRLVLRGQRNSIIIMLAGALIVLIVYLIPILGTILFVVATWMGVGMVLLHLRGYYARPVYAENLPEVVESPEKPKVRK